MFIDLRAPLRAPLRPSSEREMIEGLEGELSGIIDIYLTVLFFIFSSKQEEHNK